MAPVKLIPYLIFWGMEFYALKNLLEFSLIYINYVRISIWQLMHHLI